MHSFPNFSYAQTFLEWRANPSQWLPLAIDLARSRALPHANPHVFPKGTNLVVGLDFRLILKIFPPMLRHQFISECAGLRQLNGRLSIPVREIIQEGERTFGPLS
jgi:hygromycin-B 7''-O-kinase